MGLTCRCKPCLVMRTGYFSLNVPSGLTLYWFTNNLLTTAQQVRARLTSIACPCLCTSCLSC